MRCDWCEELWPGTGHYSQVEDDDRLCGVCHTAEAVLFEHGGSTDE